MSDLSQYENVQAVINGDRNLAIIELRKDEVLYKLLARFDLEKLADDVFVDLSYCTTGDLSDGREAVVYRPGYLVAYHDLLENRDQYKRYEFQIAMGSLLGYDPKDCVEFAASPPDCGCEKCGGEETPEDLQQRLEWRVAGLPPVINETYEQLIARLWRVAGCPTLLINETYEQLIARRQEEQRPHEGKVTIGDQVWEEEDGKKFRNLYFLNADGRDLDDHVQVYGKLMEVDYNAVHNNPDLQPHSRGV